MAYIFWDPSRAMTPFDLPILGRPILWYGFFFALGFFLGYWILLYLLKHYECKKGLNLRQTAERIVFYIVIGVVIGARLGDVLFYQSPSEYLRDPLSIIKIWEGGLASHGGALGAIVAIFFCARSLKKLDSRFSFLPLLDLIATPTALVCACIRVGNFFNQEILGKATTLPWGVIFGHPADGSAPLPRHPVQLYEAIYYFVVFLALLFLWRTTSLSRKKGAACGLLLLFVFLFRFLIEFLKEEQSLLVSKDAFLDMGQWLSIPFILLGLFLSYKSIKGYKR